MTAAQVGLEAAQLGLEHSLQVEDPSQEKQGPTFQDASGLIERICAVDVCEVFSPPRDGGGHEVRHERRRRHGPHDRMGFQHPRAST